MSITAVTFLLLAGILCIWIAQRLAIRRGRSAKIWMMAAAILGPLPLVPLAMLPKQNRI